MLFTKEKKMDNLSLLKIIIKYELNISIQQEVGLDQSSF